MNINGLFLELNESDHTAVISNSPEAKGELFIPRSYSGYAVVGINKNAFRMNKQIKSIKFAENSELRKICKKAFYGSSITSIYLPSSLQELENCWSYNALYLDKISISPKNNFFSSFNDNLILRKFNSESIDYDMIVYCNKNAEDITIPSFIKYISGYAFEGCENINKIVFSESSKLLSIGKGAFSFTNIKILSIPNSVECLEDGWCHDAFNLIGVILQPNNTNFKYLDDKHKVILSKSDKNNQIFDVISFASRNITEVIIPSYITRICSDSFCACRQLELVEIHKDSMLNSIGKNAFCETLINYIFIPKHVLKISKRCFGEIFNEFTVDFDDESELLSIEDYAFSKSYINKISIPSHVKSIGKKSFYHCHNLTELEFKIDSKLLKIGFSSFYSSKITTIIIPEHVKKIEKYAFSKCRNLQLVDFSLNKNLKEIDENLFSFSTAQKVIFSKYIIKINDFAFFKCLYLEYIFIPDDSKLSSIGSCSFSCSQINEVFFPQYLEELKENWCYYTPNIYDIIISPDNKNFIFYDQNHTIVLGKSNKDLDKFDSIVLVNRSVITITIPSFIKYLCSCSLSSCQELKKVEFQKDSQLISLGSNAFSSSFFEYIIIPHSANIIGKESFKHCFLIKTIEFLGENIIFGENCFDSCSDLMLISFPNTQTVKFNETEFNNFSESLFIFTNANTKFI